MVKNKYKNKYEEVKKFHEAFDHPVGSTPKPLNLERMYDRSKWTLEEIVETIYASCNSEQEFNKKIAEMKQDLQKIASETIEKNKGVPNKDSEKLVGQVDGLIDAIYFVYGSFVELGVDPNPIFEIVQNSNMGKLGEDGKPIIRKSDGKIMKPEGWEEKYAPEPRIKKELEKQKNVQQN